MAWKTIHSKLQSDGIACLTKILSFKGDVVSNHRVRMQTLQKQLTFPMQRFPADVLVILFFMWKAMMQKSCSGKVAGLLKDVKHPAASKAAFAAPLANGSVVTWGDDDYGDSADKGVGKFHRCLTCGSL